jgi:hypothetical protein
VPRRVLVIVSIVLALTVLGSWTVPVLAADTAGSSPAPAQSMGRIGRVVLLAHLLIIKDEAKVDALLARAVENHKLSQDQAAKIKKFWTNHHQQFTSRVVLRRLMRIQDEAKLKDLLTQAVSVGRIDQSQADRIITAWEKLHSK